MFTTSGNEGPSKVRGRQEVGRGEMADPSPDLELSLTSTETGASMAGLAAAHRLSADPDRHLWELPADAAILGIATLVSPTQLRELLGDQDGRCEGGCPVSASVVACRRPCPFAEHLETLLFTTTRGAIAHVRTRPLIALAEFWLCAQDDLAPRGVASFFWALSTDPRWELSVLCERVARELSIRALRSHCGWLDEGRHR